MSVEQKRQYKKVYVLAVNATTIENSTLAELHGVSSNVIDKWLYVNDRYPPFKALLELWDYLRKTSSFVHPSLHAIIDGTFTRVQMMAIRDTRKISRANPLIDGARRFVYHGHILSSKEIGKRLGKSDAAVNHAIRKLNLFAGNCVDSLDEYFKDERRRRRAVGGNGSLYLFNGDKKSASELAKIFNVSQSTIREKIRSIGVDDGDDVSEIDFSATNKPARIYSYLGTPIATKEIAKMMGVSMETARKRLNKSGIELGGEISELIFSVIKK